MREITLTKGKVALVDDEDYERLNKYKWSTNSCAGSIFYARRWVSSKSRGNPHHETMHRHIMNPPNGKGIDHIDGNGLNNQKSNLRIVNQRENCQNRHQIKTSQFPGVHLRTLKNTKTLHRWQAQIQIRDKIKYLGIFKTEEEAQLAYKEAADCISSGLPLKDPPVTLREGKTSKYLGVNWDKFRKKWKSRVQINGKIKFLGRFSTEEQALEARRKFIETSVRG